jgi:hypothetical protein
MPDIGDTKANNRMSIYLLDFIGEVMSKMLRVMASGILCAATPRKMDGAVLSDW